MTTLTDRRRLALRRLLLGKRDLGPLVVLLRASTEPDSGLLDAAKRLAALVPDNLVDDLTKNELTELGVHPLSARTLAEYIHATPDAPVQQPDTWTGVDAKAKADLLKELVSIAPKGLDGKPNQESRERIAALPIHRCAGGRAVHAPLSARAWVVDRAVATVLPAQFKHKGHPVFSAHDEKEVSGLQRAATEPVESPSLSRVLLEAQSKTTDHSQRTKTAVALLKVLESADGAHSDVVKEMLADGLWLPDANSGTFLKLPTPDFGTLHGAIIHAGLEIPAQPHDDLLKHGDLLKQVIDNGFVLRDEAAVKWLVAKHFHAVGLKCLTGLVASFSKYAAADVVAAVLGALPPDVGAQAQAQADIALALRPLQKMFEKVALDTFGMKQAEMESLTRFREQLSGELLKSQTSDDLVRYVFEGVAPKLIGDPTRDNPGRDILLRAAKSLWPDYLVATSKGKEYKVPESWLGNSVAAVHKFLVEVNKENGSDLGRFPVHERPDHRLTELPIGALLLTRFSIEAVKELKGALADASGQVVLLSEDKDFADLQLKASKGPPDSKHDVKKNAQGLGRLLAESQLQQPNLCRWIIELIQRYDAAPPDLPWVAVENTVGKFGSIPHVDLYDLGEGHSALFGLFSRELQAPLAKGTAEKLRQMGLVEHHLDAWRRAVDGVTSSGLGLLVGDSGPSIPPELLEVALPCDPGLLRLWRAATGADEREWLVEVLSERVLPNDLVDKTFEALTKRLAAELEDDGWAAEGWWSALLTRFAALARRDETSLKGAMALVDRTLRPPANSASGPDAVVQSEEAISLALTVLEGLLEQARGIYRSSPKVLAGTQLLNRNNQWAAADNLFIDSTFGPSSQLHEGLKMALGGALNTSEGDGPDGAKPQLTVMEYIAETKLSEDPTWRSKLGLLGLALGDRDAAEALLDDYTRKQLAEQLMVKHAAEGVKPPTIQISGDYAVSIVGSTKRRSGVATSLLVKCSDTGWEMLPPSTLNGQPGLGLLERTIDTVVNAGARPELLDALKKAWKVDNDGPVHALNSYRENLKNVNEWLDYTEAGIQKLLANADDKTRAGTLNGPSFWNDFFVHAGESTTREALEEIARARITQRGYTAHSVLFELLQNADDALLEASKILGYSELNHTVEVKNSPKELVFTHYGRPIGETRRPPGTKGNSSEPDAEKTRIDRWRWDLRAMLRWGTTTKTTARGDQNRVYETGFYGLGFKSIYLLARGPHVQSGSLSFNIVAGIIPELTELGTNGTGAATQDGPFRPTTITLPYRHGVASTAREAVDHFRKLVPYGLLFTQSIRSVRLSMHEQSGGLTFGWERVWPDADVGIKALIWREKQTKETVLLFGDGKAKSPQDLGFARLAFFVELTPPSTAKGEAQSSATSVKVKMPGDDVPVVWVLAPTKADAGLLPFLVSGRFVVNEGRGDLRQDADQSSAVKALENVVTAAVLTCQEDLSADGQAMFGDFLRSLWTRFFEVELAKNGTAHDFLRKLLWGESGLLGFVAEEGAPLRGLPPESRSEPPDVNLQKLKRSDNYFLLRGPLIEYYRSLEEPERVVFKMELYELCVLSKAPNQTHLPVDRWHICFDAPPNERGWCPRFILEQLGFMKFGEQIERRERLCVWVDLSHVGEKRREAIKAASHPGSPLQQALVMQAFEALTQQVSTNPSAVLDTVMGDLSKRLTDLGVSVVSIATTPPQLPPPSDAGLSDPALLQANLRLSDDEARMAIRRLREIAANRNRWHREWHEQEPIELKASLSAGLRNQGDFDRDAWMRLFCLGTTQRLQGQQTAAQHSGFITHLRSQVVKPKAYSGVEGTWWTLLFGAPPDAARWFAVLDQWKNGRKEGAGKYDWWFSSLPELFVASTGIVEYAEQLLYLPDRERTPPQLLTAQIDPELEGTTLNAPPVPRLRASWVVRELTRIGFYEARADGSSYGPTIGESVYPWCFEVRSRLVVGLHVLGCNVVNPRSNPKWRGISQTLDSRLLWSAWRDRVNHLFGAGQFDLTLNKTFDLAFHSKEFKDYLWRRKKIELSGSST